MAHSYLNKCESGERAIDVAELWALAAIYGKPLSFFAPDR
jgi:transcriptional regulator with XRE-family HTH domain